MFLPQCVDVRSEGNRVVYTQDVVRGNGIHEQVKGVWGLTRIERRNKRPIAILFFDEGQLRCSGR